MKSNVSNNQRGGLSHRKILYLGFLLLFITACVLPGSVQPTPIVITATPPISTETPLPTVTAAVTPTAPNNPSCTVLQDLNLRSGPGTAYNPPIAVLKGGTEFVPIGFNPQGVPGGPWVQTQVNGQTGWVSAGQQFVSCNLELATLPRVEVPPPPRGVPPRVGTGAVDGDNISSFRFSLDYNPDYFVRMYVFRSDDPDEVFSAGKDGRGITSVKFNVSTPNGNRTFYESTERNAGYCIFGGGEPDCNPWAYENGQYKWTAGGDLVEAGNYKLTITVTAGDGEVGQWFIDINIALQ